MGKKSKKNRTGVVYSTNSDYEYSYSEDEYDELEPSEQRLTVLHDRKKRKGKTVTLILGFEGSEQAFKDLAKMLKSKCGVGGSVKDGEIIIQGQLKDKIKDLLVKERYTHTKTSGG